MDSPRSKSKSQAYFPTTQADRAVAKLAASQWGVLSLDELRACGLNKAAVGVRVRRGNLHRLYHGIYVVGHRNLPLEGQFLAVVKACGAFAVLSHYSAAALRCLVKWDGRPFEITAPSKHTHPRIKAHRSDSIERELVNGISVTTKLRTVIDLRAVADDETVKRALRAAKFTAAELAQLPPRLVDLGAVHTRSPLEDSAYDIVVRAGLQRPSEVNAPYRLPSGTVYPDLRWPELRLIVEVDSAEWHDDPLAQLADRERQAELEAAGERVLRVRKPELANRPRRFLTRLRAAGVSAA
jgi:predicted transcriptional regulator of viral defense system